MTAKCHSENVDYLTFVAMRNGRLTFVSRLIISMLIASLLMAIIWMTSQFKEPPTINAAALLWCAIVFATFESVIATFRFIARRQVKSSKAWQNAQLLVGSSFAGMLVYSILFYGFRLLDHSIHGTPLPSIMDALLSAAIGLVLALFSCLIQFILSAQSNYMTEQLEKERYKGEATQANLVALKNQLDPHFLFNNFNTLYYLIEEDTGLAREFLKNMSDVYRQVLQGNDKAVIAATEEYDLAMKYLAVLKQRYHEALTIDDQVDRSLLNGKALPPLVLQQLIENAIKHNKIDVNANLSITIKCAQNRISVHNNLQRKKTEHSSGIGLQNVKQRYECLTTESVDVSNENNTFIVSIPLLDNDN